ncbi:MAG: 2-hydroxyglutaryl-CoA dehydratase [Chloroflexi bacterium]|nr:2-hydroxyglutaryl-CoA dehydratase [Chloroflexota bacterium]
MTKVVIMNRAMLASVIGPTGPEHRKLANRVMEEALAQASLPFDDITYVVATGYGRINVPFADKQITEISCHARGVSYLLPRARTVIDIGGQDCKAIKLNDNGRVVEFVMNDKCAAGTGRFLEVAAEGLGIKLEDMGRLSLEAKSKVEIGSTCTVFAAQEVVAKLSEGVPLPEIIAGLHEAIAARIHSMVGRLKIEREVALTGGGAKNIGLVKALEAKLGFPVLLPPEPLLTGAIGAALLGKDIVKQAAASGTPLPRSERRLQEVTLFTR